MKKKLLVVFFLFTSVLMFAERFTIVSFNINYKNSEENDKRETFYKALEYLVDHNKADIILLQEVWLPVDDKKAEIAMNEFTSHLGNIWRYYTTAKDMKSFSNRTQHNVVLYKQSKLNANYLNESNLLNKHHQTVKICESTFNNVQAVEFTTHDNESFVVVNTHLSPHNSYGINKETDHKKDFNNLKKFIDDIGINTPLILGGDFNYSTKDLRIGFGNKMWTVDGKEINELEPWVTSLGGDNPWDHFIFNIDQKFGKFNVRVRKAKVPKYNKFYSMRHAFDNEKNRGVIIKKDGDYLEFDRYIDEVSDHLPICITIETNN